MTDPVSEELARRAGEPLPWRWALVVALALHLAALGGLLLAARPKARALTLPAVRVHLASALELPAPSKPTSTPVKSASPTAKVVPKREQAPQAPHSGKKTAPPSPPVSPKAAKAASAPGGTTRQTSTSSLQLGQGLAVGAGEEQSFPYDYYLQRLLATVEANWFKPQAPPGTRCRVRCRIARSGELLEAGLEESSPHAAFDRAALRAVYAAAPFPPLPQGFGRYELILHLEFVQ